MPERLDKGVPIRDLAREPMYPTTMQATRDMVCIRDSWQDAHRRVEDAHGNFMRKLGRKVFDFLRRAAD
jgi:hypothetical protein